jgi:aerobic-type carbon monoxide dehydrogenase small subunit (CoxS/CutS family)
MVLNVNGNDLRIHAAPTTPLLYVLRDELGLNGAKYGCGVGQCGACTVLVNGRPAFSCITPVSSLAGRRIRTVEGLGTAQRPGIVQQAFAAEQAAQCGYCIAGMIMRAQALLEQNPSPIQTEVREFMQPNLCRCGTHPRILRAIARAAASMRAAQPASSARHAGPPG